MTVVKENPSNETVDNHTGEESTDRPSQQESEADTDDESSKTVVVKRKDRRDSGQYPPNWNMLLNQNESRPPPLAGIKEVCK